MIEFDDNTFFYMILPPILFASGYNMYRKRFFMYFGYICLFGVVGTLVTYAVFSSLTILSMNHFGQLESYSFLTQTYSYFTLSTMEILLMCSLLCSTDVVAAISIIKYKEQPKLFSIVFGEGIINDAVCIILFNTVMRFSNPEYTVGYMTPFDVTFSFCWLALMSTLVGVVIGMSSAILLKKVRLMAGNSIHETALIFCFGNLAYVISELLGFSGIIALLASGIVMAHYTYYNISKQGREVTTTAFNVMGFGC
jgi:NhaP-type Na+/H+ or K+/H+ antiporter